MPDPGPSLVSVVVRTRAHLFRCLSALKQVRFRLSGLLYASCCFSTNSQASDPVDWADACENLVHINRQLSTANRTHNCSYQRYHERLLVVLEYDLLEVAANVSTLLDVDHQTLVQVLTLFNCFLDALLVPFDGRLSLHADLLKGEHSFLCKQFCIFTYIIIATPTETKESSFLRRHSYRTLYNKFAQVLASSATLSENYIARYKGDGFPYDPLVISTTPHLTDLVEMPGEILCYARLAGSDGNVARWLDTNIDVLCLWLQKCADKALEGPFGRPARSLVGFLFQFAQRAPLNSGRFVLELLMRYMFDVLTAREDAVLFALFVELTVAFLEQSDHRRGYTELINLFSEKHISLYLEAGLQVHSPQTIMIRLVGAIVASIREDVIMYLLCEDVQFASLANAEVASLWGETLVDGGMEIPSSDLTNTVSRPCDSDCSCHIENKLLDEVRRIIHQMTMEQPAYERLVAVYLARCSGPFTLVPTSKRCISKSMPLAEFIILQLPNVMFSPRNDDIMTMMRRALLSLTAPITLTDGQTVVFDFRRLFLSILYLVSPDKPHSSALGSAPAKFDLGKPPLFEMQHLLCGFLGPAQVFLIQIYCVLFYRKSKDFYCSLAA